MPNFDEKRIRVNRISYTISSIVLKIMGWKAYGKMPDTPKAVLIIAHHTSNWDFPIALMLSYKLKIRAFWLGKDSLFKGMFGGVFRALGGTPVDRNSSHDIVTQVSNAFKEHSNFILALSPEGTRKYTPKWRTGFYYIAKAANVPIICTFIDFERKVGGVGPTIYLSDDIEKDLNTIREFYSTVVAKKPELASAIEVKK